MTQNPLPDLPLANWRTSRDTIHGYCRVLGKIRQALTPPQPHWRHVSLRAYASGLTTTPMPAGDQTVELTIDFMHHLAGIRTSRGDWQELVLEGQPSAIFYEDTMAALAELGVTPAVDPAPFADRADRAYDDKAIERFWSALALIDVYLKGFKGTLPGYTGPVQLWPHHFDLALSWLSGEFIAGVDPDDVDNAAKQILFGFSTGDDAIPEPYFYNSAYPWPEALTGARLPAGATWETTHFKGARLPYARVLETDDPQARLCEFWHTTWVAAAALLRHDGTG